MNNEEGWEDMDLHDPQATHPIIKFLKFVDQEDMQFKLEEALTNAILEGLKVFAEQVKKMPTKVTPPAELELDDSPDQDAAGSSPFDAPFNPPQIAEMCPPAPARRPRINIRIRRNETSKRK